jgi:GAF domain-containing protein
VSSHRPEDLAEIFADLARRLQAADSVDHTLTLICELAVELVDGCEHAGVTDIKKRQVLNIATSSDVAVIGDRIQGELDAGPCLDAIRDAESVWVPDLATDERWNGFGPRVAEETGMRSMTCFRLFVQEDNLGALNLYSSKVDGFKEEDEPFASALAAHAAVAVTSASQHEEIEELEDALQTNRTIGKATGILMATRHLTGDQAFALLVSASQRSNTKLRDIAARVVERCEQSAGSRTTS